MRHLSQVDRFLDDCDSDAYGSAAGSLRVRYLPWAQARGRKMTFAGIRRGSRLVFDEDLDGGSVFEGTPAADEVISTNDRNVAFGEIVFGAMPAVALVILAPGNLGAN